MSRTRYNYELAVTDLDGETQRYRVLARSMARVLRGVPTILNNYGHKVHRQIIVNVAELVPEAEMYDAITLH